MKDSEIIEQMRALMVPIVNKVAELEQRIADLEEIVHSVIEEVPPDGAN